MSEGSRIHLDRAHRSLGQCVEYQACCTGTLRRKSHPWERLVHTVYHASSSIISAFHSNLRGSSGYRQHQVTAGRRAGSYTFDQSVPASVQAERQGKFLLFAPFSPLTCCQTVCHATSTFIAHLCNQFVAHEIVALQILLLCLDRPTDDSIEVAVGFMREVGLFLSENSPKANNTVFERFRAVLHEGAISKRCQYMIEVLFQVRKDRYKDNPAIGEGLDLVEEEEQITHRITLDDELQVQESLSKSIRKRLVTKLIYCAQIYLKSTLVSSRTRRGMPRSSARSLAIPMTRKSRVQKMGIPMRMRMAVSSRPTRPVSPT